MWLSFEGGAAKSNKSLDGKRQQMNFHRGRITFQPPTASASGEGSVARYHFQRSKIPTRNVLGKARKKIKNRNKIRKMSRNKTQEQERILRFLGLQGLQNPKSTLFQGKIFWPLDFGEMTEEQ